MTDHYTGDIAATLVQYRPTPDAFEDEWGLTTRVDALTQILDHSIITPQRIRWVSRHRRWVIASSIAACAVAATVVASVVLPTGTPGGPDPASAATLERLAVTAGQAGGTVGEHQFAFVRQDSEQTAEPGAPVPPGRTRVGKLDRESSQQWTAPSGVVWTYDQAGDDHTTCLSKRRYRPTPAGVNDYADLSAADLAALPTDPDRLATYLDAHPSGDNRGADNAFTVTADLVRSGLASPALRAASIRVLAHTNGIDVHTGVRDAAGRTAIRVDKSFKYGLNSLFFDPRTSKLLEEQTTQANWLSRSITRKFGIVDSIPTDLPRCAAPTQQPG